SITQVSLAAVGMPHVPEEIRNPIVECIIPVVRDGYMALNFGMRLGLTGWLSPLPWLAVTLIVVVICRPSGRSTTLPRVGWGWQAIYAIAVVGIVTGLSLVRSPSTVDLHAYRYRLLRNAADIEGSDSLLAAAAREYVMSQLPAQRR